MKNPFISFLRKAGILAVVFAAVSPVAVAENEFTAPFGLEWGASKSKVQNMGVMFSRCGDEGAYEQCFTSDLPKNAPNAESYRLRFSPKHGLIEVTYISNSFFGDKFGNKGKKAYTRIKQQLSDKYGEPSLTTEKEKEITNRGIFDFYTCLKNDDCDWFTGWFVAGGLIELSLHHERYNTGYLLLFYQSPVHDKAIKEYTQDAF